jgi:UDP-N-acetyl-2-amino-2-deoxyglucuronate dehydrogenase
MSKLKVCIIGCGRISINHVESIRNNKELLQLVAVCDLIEANADRVLEQSSFTANELSCINKYTDYMEMLKIEKPDLVAISTESGKHAEIGLAVIAAGCSVIIEKPIALSLQDADNLILAAKEKDVVLCTCHQNRFNKSIQKIRLAQEAGRFGTLLHGAAHIRWSRNLDYYTQAPWRGTWAQDGGVLMNQCIHNIDLLRWMMGDDVVEVMAYTDKLIHDYIEAEDLGIAIVKFSNGSYGLIEGTTNVFPANLEETLYIFGQNGTVKAGGKSVNSIDTWQFADNLDNSADIISNFSDQPKNIYGFGHTPLYADVADAIIKHRKPYVDGEAGKRALELVLAIYKSSRDHCPVKFPLTNFSTADMTQFCFGR